MPDHVLHDDNGVVHQNTDGKNQGKKGDAVEGITIEIKNGQGQGQGHRNGQGHHPGLATAEGEPDQQADRDDGDHHVVEQFVGFFPGRLAVMAGDGNVEVVGDHLAAGVFNAVQNPFGHRNGVGPFALGHGQGNGRIDTLTKGGRIEAFFFGRRSGAEKDVLSRFARSVAHHGHIPQINRPVARNADHHRGHLLDGAQKTVGMDQHLAFGRGYQAGIAGLVGRLQHAGHPVEVQLIGGQPDGIDLDPHLAGLAADEGGDGNIVLALDEVFHLGRGPAQGIVVLVVAPEGQGQNGHVIDITGLDQRRRGGPGDAVIIGHELGLQTHDGLFLVLANVKPDNGHGHARAGGGVNVFHPGDLPEQFFHGRGDPLFHFPGVGAGHPHKDVDHGNDNLGFLFPGQRDNGRDTKKDGSENNQRRQFGIDEIIREGAGNTRAVAHGTTSTRAPSAISGGGCVR